MKTRSKVIVSSTLAIAMSASVIAGTTFALFTSESSVNIAVTSGKVDVQASIASMELYSPAEIDFDTALETETSRNGATVNEDGLSGTFKNKGTAAVQGGEVTLNGVTPGDKLTLNVSVTSASSIAFKYRMKFACVSGDEQFFDQLLVSVNDEFYTGFVSEWKDGTVSTDGSRVNEEALKVSVELPTYAGNKYQGKTCRLSFSVEAVQGNAQTAEEEALKTYFVTDQEQLAQTLADMKSGEAVILAGGNGHWTDAEIAFEDKKEIKVNGFHMGTLTLNAPQGTVKYYNAVTDTVNVTAIADRSLHIFGTVTSSLALAQGRAVLEEGANVACGALVPSENAKAKLEVSQNAALEAVTVNVEQASASAELVIPEGVTVGLVDVLKTEGKAVVENKGTVETLQTAAETNVVYIAGENSELLNSDGVAEGSVTQSPIAYVSNEAELTAALADENCAVIEITSAFEVRNAILVGRSVTIRGNNFDITSKANRGVRVIVNDVELNLIDFNLLNGGGLERAVQADPDCTGIKFVLDGCTLEATYYTLNICNGAGVDLTVLNCDLKGWGVVNAWSAGYKIYIENSTLLGYNDKSYSAAGWNGFGTVVLEGDTTGKTELGADGVAVEIVNSTIIADTNRNGNIQKVFLFNSESKSNFVKAIDCKYVLGNEYCLFAVDNGTDNSLAIYDTKAGTAQVSGEAAFKDALAAEWVEKIELLGDITLDENVTTAKQIVVPQGSTVTFDLNGFALCSLFGGEGFANYGTLTIDDGSEGKTGLIFNDYYKDHATKEYETWEIRTHAFTNYGTLTVNGGTFGDNDTDKENANASTWGAAIMNNEGGVCTINGGNFTCLDNWYHGRYSYAIRNLGEMTINGATVYGKMNGGIACDGGLVTVNGGSCTLSFANTYHVFTAWVENGAKIVINGGRFESDHTNGALFSAFSGMPSWDVSENLAANGYTVTGGTFILDGEEVIIRDGAVVAD